MSDYEDANSRSEEDDLSSCFSSPIREGMRRRHPLLFDTGSITSEEVPGIQEVQDFLASDNSSVVEEDYCTGCPLPSTPVDPSMLDLKEVTDALKYGNLDLGHIMQYTREPAEEFVRKVWEASWSVCNFKHLPQWLQDNDYLYDGHRPPLPSFSACFKSIFRIHTETGNIWTHLLGCIAFIGVLAVFMFAPSNQLQWPDKLVFGAFFISAIVCLGLSFAFHTVCCHSEFVGKLFSKLDYCGIAILITGSFIPWLYYSFYCELKPRIIYMVVVIVLGISCMIVSLWDKFSEARLRPLRAGIFAGFGLSGVIPAVHYSAVEGWFNAISYASLGWLILMGSLYILGALLYAFRVPECFFPGKFDIWFQSHQIFHLLVIAATFVHYHGITEMASYRFSIGNCMAQAALVL